MSMTGFPFAARQLFSGFILILAVGANAALNRLKAVKGPVDFDSMSQAYEAFAEAAFCFALKYKGVTLERTQGTGQH